MAYVEPHEIAADGTAGHSDRDSDAGWSSPVARQAHNLKVTGSNPVPATKRSPSGRKVWRASSVSGWARPTEDSSVHAEASLDAMMLPGSTLRFRGRASTSGVDEFVSGFPRVMEGVGCLSIVGVGYQTGSY